MHHPPLQPSGWHRSFAPGGCESWAFRVTTDSIHVYAMWMDGDGRSPQYYKAYSRFRKNPTKFKPPIARDFPAMGLMVESPSATLLDRIAFLPGSFQGSADEIRIGENIARWNDATIHLKLQLPSAACEFLFNPTDQGRYRATGFIKFNDGVTEEIDGNGQVEHELSVIISKPAPIGRPAPFGR
jgi:hypothetical protein